MKRRRWWGDKQLKRILFSKRLRKRISIKVEKKNKKNEEDKKMKREIVRERGSTQVIWT